MLLLYAAVIFIVAAHRQHRPQPLRPPRAAGVTATFALYVLINGAMVMGLAPVVGVPMPLLS